MYALLVVDHYDRKHLLDRVRKTLQSLSSPKEALCESSPGIWLLDLNSSLLTLRRLLDISDACGLQWQISFLQEKPYFSPGIKKEPIKVVP